MALVLKKRLGEQTAVNLLQRVAKEVTGASPGSDYKSNGHDRLKIQRPAASNATDASTTGPIDEAVLGNAVGDVATLTIARKQTALAA